MRYPNHCSELKLQVFNEHNNKFEYFTKFDFEYLRHNDNFITLIANNCKYQKIIPVPFDEEASECTIRVIAEDYAQPFNGNLFSQTNSSIQFNINYLPLCWMCFSRSPMIIISLDDDDEIIIRYRRGIFF